MSDEKKLDNIIKVIDLLEKIKAMLAGLVSHSMLIGESLKAVIGDCKAVNQNMREAALGLKALAAETTKADEPEPEPEASRARAVQAANDAVSFRPAGI
jgi:hypothetical protein